MNIQQALRLALQHHQSGRLMEAEAFYQKIIVVDPRQADALHLLGVLADQTGRHDAAVELIRQAIALKPGDPDYHSNLGNALREQGQRKEAIRAFRQALALRPLFSEAHNNLANALKEEGHLDEAIAAYRRALVLSPDLPEVHNNLGNALVENGELEKAVGAYRRAIVLRPDYAEAYSHLGNALRVKGELDGAIAACRQALTLRPDFQAAYSHLGNALRDKGQWDEAIIAYQNAVAINPRFADAFTNLGAALSDKGCFEESMAACRRAIELQPDLPMPHCNLGRALVGLGHYDDAVAAYLQAIACKPECATAHNNLACAFKDMGKLDQAIVHYRRATTFAPGNAEYGSNLVYTLHFQPDYDAPAIRRELRRFSQRYADPVRQFILPHDVCRTPGRRLRIGYVSADFCQHVVGFNMLPLLAGHDANEFEVFCYAQVTRPDAMTERFRSRAQHWRSTVGVSDEQLAARIRDDRIDILVDLGMHLAGNRLLVFARKPAPVQVTFGAYPGSTGLETIDYRLSDPFLDPPGLDESCYSEETIRLPHSFWCYDPFDAREIHVNTLPAIAHGFVTFGCLNNFCKVNERVLRLWAEILRVLPSSRLLLLAPDGNHRQSVLDLFGQEGIAAGRIEFFAGRPRRAYLELFHQIDVSLDTLPYSGHTTSLDSLWMGVPVMTLVGQTVVGRAGRCQLMNLHLPELIAATREEYIRGVVALATDLPRLSEMRRTLRERMECTPLMDARRFARDVEAAYREMWCNWCMREG